MPGAGILFSREMQPLDEQQPRKTVVRHDRDKVVYGRDERTGGDGGIDVDLFKEDGDPRAGNAREQHRRHERDADAAGNAERHERRFAAQENEIRPDRGERRAAEDQTVYQPHGRLLPYEAALLRGGRLAVHENADRNGERLRADVARHVQHERLEAHDERELRHNALEKPDDAGNDHAEREQHEQPRQTLAHALSQRFVEILLRGKTGELGIVLAERIVHRLDKALCRHDAEQPVFVVQHGDGILGIVLNAWQRVLNALVRIDIRVRCGDEIAERVALAGDDEVLEINGTVKGVVGVNDIERGDVVMVGSLRDELVHRRLDAQPLGDDDAVRRHDAAELVLVVDPEPGNLAPFFLVHQLDERVLLAGVERFEIVHRRVGVHAREHVHPLAETQLVEIRRHRLGVFQNGGKLRDAERVVNAPPLGGRERFQHGGNVVFVVIEQLLAERLRRESAADQLRQLAVIVRVAERRAVHFVFHFLPSLDRFSCAGRKRTKKSPSLSARRFTSGKGNGDGKRAGLIAHSRGCTRFPVCASPCPVFVRYCRRPCKVPPLKSIPRLL